MQKPLSAILTFSFLLFPTQNLFANDEPNALPTISVTPQTQTVEEGSNGHFTLSSTNTRSISAGGASCDISGAGLQNYILSDGNYNIGPMKYSHGVNGVVTFDFKCYGANNQIASQSITINVTKKEIPPPPVGVPQISFDNIPDTKNGDSFNIQINTINIPDNTTLNLSSSMGNIYPKSVTIQNNQYTGNVKLTSAINKVKLTAIYQNTQSNSNEFNVSSACNSTLSELELTHFELNGLCTPRNISLPNPDPIYPIQNEEVNSTTVTFQWSSVSNAETYSLYVRNEDTGILEVDKEGLTATNHEVTNLKPGAKYRWNVRAKNAQGGGWLSELYYFRVSVGGTENPNENILTIKLLDETNEPIHYDNIKEVEILCFEYDESCIKNTNLQGVPLVYIGYLAVVAGVAKITDMYCDTFPNTRFSLSYRLGPGRVKKQTSITCKGVNTLVENGASLALSLMPVVGEGYDIITLWNGKDPVTGEQLNKITKMFTFIGLISGIGSGKVARETIDIALKSLAQTMSTNLDTIMHIAENVVKSDYAVSSLNDIYKKRDLFDTNVFIDKVKVAFKSAQQVGPYLLKNLRGEVRIFSENPVTKEIKYDFRVVRDFRNMTEDLNAGRLENKGFFTNDRPGATKLTDNIDSKEYYTEHKLSTPEYPNSTGPERLITGNNGELYYTSDHYKTFINLITGETLP